MVKIWRRFYFHSLYIVLRSSDQESEATFSQFSQLNEVRLRHIECQIEDHEKLYRIISSLLQSNFIKMPKLVFF